MEILPILEKAVNTPGTSDIFLIAGLPVTYKVNGTQHREEVPLTSSNTRTLAEDIYRISNRNFKDVNNGARDEDFSFSIAGLGRFRINLFKQRGSLALVIRTVAFGLPVPRELNVTEDVMNISQIRRGLVLITGPTDSGKSTTMACIVDRINKTREGHIVIIEDPIEHIHHHDKCIITQREIPVDSPTFEEGLKSAMHESPDAIIVDRIRNEEIANTIVNAANTGKLVFSTLQAVSASKSINQFVNLFKEVDRQHARTLLSDALQAIICEQLVPTIDGKRIPVYEILLTNPAIRNLIRDNKVFQIDTIIASSNSEGMKSMDQSLFQLVQSKIITADTALKRASFPEALKNKLLIEGIIHR